MNSFLYKNIVKPNFWIVHIVTWLGFIIVDFNNNLHRITDDNGYIFWILSDLTGFLIATFLRYIYKLFYSRLNSFIKQFGLIFTFSILGGIAWYYVRGLFWIFAFPLIFTDFNTYLNYTTDPQGLVTTIFWEVNPLLGWSLGYFGLKYYFNLTDEKIRSERMQMQAKNAQLQMLRYQINPHFLFNSLNSIKALTYENPEHAGLMITELSEFLRTTLNYNGKIFVPIQEEIDIIEKYLSIEKIRFEERLNYSVSYNKDILNKEILCFITQPLVENAIKHGLTNNPDGIKLSIDFTKIESFLVIEIANTGMLSHNKNDDGKGIRNVVERLDNAYSDKYLLCINDNDNLVTVRLLIPDKS